jgi:hypothetical protein
VYYRSLHTAFGMYFTSVFFISNLTTLLGTESTTESSTREAAIVCLYFLSQGEAKMRRWQQRLHSLSKNKGTARHCQYPKKLTDDPPIRHTRQARLPEPSVVAGSVAGTFPNRQASSGGASTFTHGVQPQQSLGYGVGSLGQYRPTASSPNAAFHLSRYPLPDQYMAVRDSHQPPLAGMRYLPPPFHSPNPPNAFTQLNQPSHPNQFNQGLQPSNLPYYHRLW